jgi:UDP:flavonoid glycosyltransferase YjiC (YdhE family)
MRITILALGSRGDIQPFVPLGRALQSAGHRVRVASFEMFGGMIAEAGLDFHPIHGDAQALLNAAGDGMLEGRANPIAMIRALRRSYATLAHSIPRDLSDAALRDTQLLLNQLPGNLYGYDLAEYLDIPHAIVAVIPLVRTRHMPMMGFPTVFARAPGYNAFTYLFAEQMAWALFRGAINRWRTQRLGLPAQPLGGPFAAIRRRRIAVINGFSAHVVSRPPDWGEHVHVTGWWFPDDPEWRPSLELSHFLDAGPPPIFIGFGSMPIKDPSRVTGTIVEAIRLSGQRAVVHAGWAGLDARATPDIFPITYAPYAWLFPRMAAVVHHGGSGTSGFAFRSGAPSLVVPFAFDQFYWGRRAAQLGVGPQALPYRELNAERLAVAIREAVSNDAMRARAAEIGRAIQAEDGVARAREIIETIART